MNSTQPKPTENTWLWLVKVFAGLFIVVLMGIHFIVNHLVVPGGLLTYSDVIAYYQNPIIPIMEGFFLIFVVGHALLGVRSIILDLNPKRTRMRWIDFILFALGATAVLYGIWLIIILVLKGTV
jgi:succinate dehydrogenase hydrophobic anchor subunit